MYCGHVTHRASHVISFICHVTDHVTSCTHTLATLMNCTITSALILALAPLRISRWTRKLVYEQGRQLQQTFNYTCRCTRRLMLAPNHLARLHTGLIETHPNDMLAGQESQFECQSQHLEDSKSHYSVLGDCEDVLTAVTEL